MKIDLCERIPYCNEVLYHYQNAIDKLNDLTENIENISVSNPAYEDILETSQLVDNLQNLHNRSFYNKESGLPLTIETSETIGICGKSPKTVKDIENNYNFNKCCKILQQEMEKNIDFHYMSEIISSSGHYKNLLFFNSNYYDTWVNNHLIAFINKNRKGYKYYVLQPYYGFPDDLDSLYKDTGIFQELDKQSLIYIAMGERDIYKNKTRNMLPDFCEFVMEYQQNQFIKIIRGKSAK